MRGVTSLPSDVFFACTLGATLKRYWMVVIVLVSTLCVHPVSAQVSKKAIITVVDSAIWTYGAQLANGYGAESEATLYSANLMLPPGDDPQLCEFPQTVYWG